MNTNITKALRAASQVLKGTVPDGTTADQITDALLELGSTRKFAGETREACFARLIREGDADAVLLAKAADQLRFAEQPDDRAVRSNLVAKAEELVDGYVKQNKQPTESLAKAYSRLASSKDEGFVALYRHLAECRDAAT